SRCHNNASTRTTTSTAVTASAKPSVMPRRRTTLSVEKATSTPGNTRYDSGGRTSVRAYAGPSTSRRNGRHTTNNTAALAIPSPIDAASALDGALSGKTSPNATNVNAVIAGAPLARRQQQHLDGHHAERDHTDDCRREQRELQVAAARREHECRTGGQ